MLQLTDWNVRRGSRVVLSGLSLKIRPGEVLGLAGPSSGGKSSLLLSIAGRLGRVEGRASWRQQVVELKDPAFRAKVELISEAGMGAVALTVREHLTYHAAARGVAGVDLDAALRQGGLSEVADQGVETLSSGLQERLLLVRSVMHEPALVLVDHSLAHLDGVGEMLLSGWIQRCRDRGAAVLWASSDKGRLGSYCDRMLVLASGVLREASDAGAEAAVADVGPSA